MRVLIFLFCVVLINFGFITKGLSQCYPDKIYTANIKTPLLYQQNNPTSLPIYTLNSSDLLELHFDDLDNYAKTYYYTFQLCNADWQPAQVNAFDFIKGFQQQRLTQYRVGSVAQVRYMHYQALLPDRNCIPIKSGNYILKVFLNGDTTQLAFTKRFYVLENKVAIATFISPPFNNEYFRTHQRLRVILGTSSLNLLGAQQQLKTILVQNNRADRLSFNPQPTFIRENEMEFSADDGCLFAAGKEFRWLDLRSMRFASERIETIQQQEVPITVVLKPDFDRRSTQYLYYRDFNGAFYVDAIENINPQTQGDYAWVLFNYVPPAGVKYTNQKVHLVGALTGNCLSDSSEMQYNSQTGTYQKKMLLKQGYYNYAYAVENDLSSNKQGTQYSIPEGDFWETENDYTVFVYYRSFSGRHDELIGISTVNSRGQRLRN